MPISTQDLIASFDPTGYVNITGAQLLQLITGASPFLGNTPFLGSGMTVVTVDVVGVPQVPDAVGTPKWQNYIWVRQSATLVTPYVWNPSAVSDATYLKWQSIAVSAIGPASITGAMIALNTITDSNIANLNYSKLTGAPVALPPSGAAGGDLLGSNYPNPTIAPLAVTTSKIALLNITLPLIAPGAALQLLRTNAGATAAEWLTPSAIVAASSGVVTTANQYKVPIVATAGAGDTGTWAMTGISGALTVNATTQVFGRLMQYVMFSTTAAQSSTKNLALTGTAPTSGNTDLLTGFGAAGTMSVTPLNAGSTLFFHATLQVSNGTGGSVFVVLVETTGAGFALKSAGFCHTGVDAGHIDIQASIASTGVVARTFGLYIAATTGTTQLNENGGVAFLGSAFVQSCCKVTEYL